MTHSHIPPPLHTRLANVSTDMSTIAMTQADALFGILSAISRLSQDETITHLAVLGKDVAQGMHNDVDVYREQIEDLLLEA
ncbi:hypothetical protein [Aquitalea pelogenes]|uniref:hypothetical protein n=1 Tax=Aquitalea pelogenes TaxID=1293573 RepID=UPI0035AFF941